MFRLISQEERLKISNSLYNEWRYRMVTGGQKAWIIKHSGNEDFAKRDQLGFLLGKVFCNISEVKTLSEQELENIKQFSSPGEYFNSSNTILVRLAHSYSIEELPNKTLEEAVATELVYSVWVRRRDAHTENRVYVKGIPIFFDFHVAFLGEPNLSDINVFFSQTEDYGRAGLWRVKTWGDFLKQFTGSIHPNAIGPFHFVNDTESFYQHVKLTKTKLKEKVSSKIDDYVQRVKFDSVREAEIIKFLKKNLETLDQDVNKMVETIRQD